MRGWEWRGPGPRREAQFRQEALNRSEAGMGDTLWTSKMRRSKKQAEKGGGGQ